MYGIQAIELYFPKTYVEQTDLELFDRVSVGKYTKGLGQKQLSFTYPFEDINSISLTVVSNLLKNYHIDPSKVGRLEIGTQTLLDKSKSTKTVLMSLFKGNNNIEGATSMNACYGATNALLNTMNWISSPFWDGRYGIVVAADIAVYEKGPARCTGGAGAIAILIGPNPKITIDRERFSFMDHQYDFYKPIPNSEYPIVDGKNSIGCYLNAVQKCYLGLKEKLNDKNIVKDTDFFCFHSPFYKMVHKAFTKMISVEHSSIGELQIQKLFSKKVDPCMQLPQRLGNIYSGSVYSTLISLLISGNEVRNKNVLMFSYGSGLCSTLFSLKIHENPLSLSSIKQISQRLSRRVKISAQAFDEVMSEKQLNYGKWFGKIQLKDNLLFENSFYLSEVDQKWRRKYSFKGSALISLNSTAHYEHKEGAQIQLSANKISSTSSQMYSNVRLQNIDKIINSNANDKFYKLPVERRLQIVEEKINEVHKGEAKMNCELLLNGGLKLQNANMMIENVIGTLTLPLAVIPEVKLNNKVLMVPMSTEEPSVVAACSAICKLISSHTSFYSDSTANNMIGQVHIPSANEEEYLLLIHSKENLIKKLNEECSMVKRGGGVYDMNVRVLGDSQSDDQCLKKDQSDDQFSKKEYVVDLYVNVCEAMGANIVNTLCERTKHYITALGITTGIAILSNYCTERMAKAWFLIPVSALARKELTGEQVSARIIQAYNFARKDQYRATTHNKGIMNGIDSVCLATGQDWRAVEAAAHSYASRNKGNYMPLTHYEIVTNTQGIQCLKGCLELPIAVGSIGGVISKNPAYKSILAILDHPTSKELAEILVTVGLAQNLAALRALAVEGIQSGHMKLHSRSLKKTREDSQNHLMKDAGDLSISKRINQITIERLKIRQRNSPKL